MSRRREALTERARLVAVTERQYERQYRASVAEHHENMAISANNDACMQTDELATATATATAYNLDHVSNSELHLSTRRLVGRSNQVFAALLAHLGEIEARGLHRERACASLHTYLVFELRVSEDAAFRRARAARLCREFPVILEHIAAGEIHLTALLLQVEQAQPRQRQRDGARCTYVDSRGHRCREMAFLELHHVSPHALGGPPTAVNLTLRCHAHNALAAEQDFGRDFVQDKREARGRGGGP
jgi:hypothetical protein